MSSDEPLRDLGDWVFRFRLMLERQQDARAVDLETDGDFNEIGEGLADGGLFFRAGR